MITEREVEYTGGVRGYFHIGLSEDCHIRPTQLCDQHTHFHNNVLPRSILSSGFTVAYGIPFIIRRQQHHSKPCRVRMLRNLLFQRLNDCKPSPTGVCEHMRPKPQTMKNQLQLLARNTIMTVHDEYLVVSIRSRRDA